MKLKQYSIIAGLFFFFSLSVHSQAKLQDDINVRNNQLQQSKGQLLVHWDIYVNGVEVSANNQLTLTPVVRGIDGQSHALKPVIINGATRNKLYKRSLRLSGTETNSQAYTVVRAERKKVIMMIPYRINIPYEAWMENASFYLVEDLCGCAGSEKAHAERLVAKGTGTIGFEKYTPQANFIAPVKEDVKQRAESGSAHISFERGKWNIRPDLFNNRAELAKVDKSLEYVKEEPTTVITGISIKAYASPEGPWEENLTISQKRAKSLLGYIREKYTLPTNLTAFAEGYGEDWGGLVSLIEQDPKVEYKDRILELIRTIDIFSGREKLIMDLDGGKPYHYMLETLFPLLRRAEYNIDYTVPAFSLEKGKELIKTKPNMVSLDEMWQIANTYEKGSAAYNDVFQTAHRVYPQDKIAHLNAAAVAISTRDYAAAKSLLENYTGDPAAWNNLGIVYMSEYRFPEAKQYLQKAKDQGISEAGYNLDILEELTGAVQESAE